MVHKKHFLKIFIEFQVFNFSQIILDLNTYTLNL